MKDLLNSKVVAFFGKKHAAFEIGLLIIVFAIAARYRFSVPNVPLSDTDTWGYLYPALSSLAGEGFQQTNGRGIAYPLFIKIILLLTHDFFFIPKIQHIIGLASGLLWWMVWCQWKSTLPERFRFAFGIQLIGIFFLTVYLWNAHAVFYESMIRPEAVFPFLGLLQILFTLSYIRTRWFSEKSFLTMIISGAFAMVTALICLSAKPSWGFAAAVPFATVTIGLFGDRSILKIAHHSGTLLLGMFLCAIWLQVVPTRLEWRRDSSSKEFLPATLFTVHAPTISKFLNAQRDKGLLSENEVAFLNNFDKRICEAKQITRDTKKYRYLGHDPDYLMYHSDTLSWFPNGQTTDAKKSFMTECYLGTIVKYPIDIASKIVSQVKVAFSDLKSSLYQSDISLKSKLEGSLKAMDFYKLPKLPQDFSKSYSSVYEKIEELQRLNIDSFTFGPRLGRFITHSLGPVLIGLIMLGWPLILLLHFKKAKSTIPLGLMPAVLVFGVFWAVCIGTTLTVAIVHSFDITRYRHILSAQHSLVLAPAIATLLLLLASRFESKTTPITNKD